MPTNGSSVRSRAFLAHNRLHPNNGMISCGPHGERDECHLDCFTWTARTRKEMMRIRQVYPVNVECVVAMVKFQAEPDKRLSLVFLVLFAAATLYLSFVIARPFLTPILSATLIAIGIYPLYLRLSRKFQNRGGAALVATLVVLIAIVLPAVLMVEKLADETTALYGWLNDRCGYLIAL